MATLSEAVGNVIDLDEEQERHRRRVVFDVVTQNLRAIGAVSLEEYLGSEYVRAPSETGVELEHDDEQHAEVVLESTSHIDCEPASGAETIVSPGLRPSPAAVAATPNVDLTPSLGPSVKGIEDLCLQYTNGKVRPYWLTVTDPRASSPYGCVLRIQLSPRSWRVYSVDTTFGDPTEAQVACAKTYHDSVLQYLTVEGPNASPDPLNLNSEPIPSSLRDKTVWTVQMYFETLPRPFPEDVGKKTAADINAPSWFNSMLQVARGSKLSTSFIWTENKFGLHGCLLRLASGTECRSFLVEPRFTKRAEAKTAICLQAMSEGVGDFIRALAKKVEDRLPPDVRKTVSSLYLPTLMSECHKIRPDLQPLFEYATEDDCCGCTMTINLDTEHNRNASQSYTVSPEYRTRHDAKIAVIASAVSKGVFEFIGLNSRALFPHYSSAPTTSHDRSTKKRKHDSGAESGSSTPGPSEGRRKRRKHQSNGNSNHTPSQSNNVGPPKAKRRHPTYVQMQSWTGPTVTASGSYPNAHPVPQTVPYQTTTSYSSTYRAPIQQQMPYTNTSSPYTSAVPTVAYYSNGTVITQYSSPPSVRVDPYHAAQYPYANGSVPQQPVPTGYQSIPPPVNQTSYSGATYSQPFQPYPPAPSCTATYAYLNAGPVPAVQPPSTSTSTSPLADQSAQSVLQPITPAPTRPQSSLTPPASVTPNPVDTVEKVETKEAVIVKPAKPRRATVTVAVEPVPESSVTELYDYCRDAGLAIPEFRHEIVTEGQENKHKVWVMIGKEKMELSATFPSLSQGQEKVAKKVLEQLRANVDSTT